MLVRLLPEQVAHYWDIIKDSVDRALPDNVTSSAARMNRILGSCLSGDLEVWANAQELGEGQVRVTGVILTTVSRDEISGTKNLYIYAMAGFEPGGERDRWYEALKTLLKYAHGLGCDRILGHVNDAGLIKYLRRIGAETRYMLVTYDVGAGYESLFKHRD